MGYYLYRFNDIDKNIIYIGRTNSIDSRLKQHFSENGHLPKECYEEVFSIDYAEVDTKNEMYLYEIYLIDLIKPKWNTANIYNEPSMDLRLPDLNWKRFFLNEQSPDVGKEDFVEMQNIRHMQNLLYKFNSELKRVSLRTVDKIDKLKERLDGDELDCVLAIESELQYLQNYEANERNLYSEVIRRR